MIIYHMQEIIQATKFPTLFAVEEANLISISIKVTTVLWDFTCSFIRKQNNKPLCEELQMFFPCLPSGNFHCKKEMSSQLYSNVILRKKYKVCVVAITVNIFLRLK